MTDSPNLGAVQIGAGGPNRSRLVDRIERDLAKQLNHLLHLSNDLGNAYASAVERLDDERLKKAMVQLDASHRRWRTQLEEYIVSLGIAPARKGDLHGLWERVRVVLGELQGDAGVLRAMATNEEEVSSAFRALRNQPGVPGEVLTILDDALQHEVYHRDFYDRALGRFVG